jgi:hypothetical protein
MVDMQCSTYRIAVVMLQSIAGPFRFDMLSDIRFTIASSFPPRLLSWRFDILFWKVFLVKEEWRRNSYPKAVT